MKNPHVVMPANAVMLPKTGDVVVCEFVKVQWLRKLPGGAQRKMKPWLGKVIAIEDGEPGRVVIEPQGRVFGDDA